MWSITSLPSNDYSHLVAIILARRKALHKYNFADKLCQVESRSGIIFLSLEGLTNWFDPKYTNIAVSSMDDTQLRRCEKDSIIQPSSSVKYEFSKKKMYIYFQT